MQLKGPCRVARIGSDAIASHGRRLEGTGKVTIDLVCARAGAIIKEIREASGAHIKILPAEDLPACGLSNDRVVQ